MNPTSSLRELALLFLRLGSTAFGGPAAHIAMMEDEVVRRRKWLSSAQFLDMIAATNFIPGPNSTEMAIHIGYERAGFKGLVVAGVSFILPATLIVLAIAWAYVHYGSLPVANDILYGIKPVVIAIVAQALWRLGRSALKNKFLIFLAVCATTASFCSAGELVILFTAACAAGAVAMRRGSGHTPPAACIALPALPPLLPAGLVIGSTVVSITLSQIFFIFLKIGSVLFGSGYVLLAFLRSDLVERLGWLSEAQLLDATAIGQVTPGPVFTTATFIGYILSGPYGAIVATIGIFLPAFFFVALSAPFLPALRRSPVAAQVLDGLNAASLALMAVVTLHLTQAAVIDWVTALVALVSLIALIVRSVNTTWLIAAGALIGFFRQALN